MASTKDEVIAQLTAAGIEHDPEASLKDLRALLPKEDEGEKEVPAKLGDYSYAVNKIKLNRSIAHVRAMVPAPEGAEFDKAVKKRYLALNGLLTSDVRKSVGSRPLNSRVQNMAPNDED